MTPGCALTFPHSWQAEILAERPMILPPRHFTYPRDAEEVERGALEVMVRPGAGAPFLGTFALGFADPAAPSGVWSCPNPDEVCAVAGGYAYVVNTRDPEAFTQAEFRPVLEVRPLAAHKLLLFAGNSALLAWGREGRAWRTERLSSEGLRIETIDGGELRGFGWDLMTDREVPFTIDLRTGQRIGGI
ncbi:MAG TPA: hypothetical protein VHX60_15015 [Acidobacteriaceae bacterium]|jgi:hypothetical protein|nr:hypothetical protein [Acidobacteriaceae bacterium]